MKVKVEKGTVDAVPLKQITKGEVFYRKTDEEKICYLRLGHRSLQSSLIYVANVQTGELLEFSEVALVFPVDAHLVVKDYSDV